MTFEFIDDPASIFTIAISLSVGIILGSVLVYFYYFFQIGSLKKYQETLSTAAQKKVKEWQEDAENGLRTKSAEAHNQLNKRQQQLQLRSAREEDRLRRREELLSQEVQKTTQLQRDLEHRISEYSYRQGQLRDKLQQLEEKEKELITTLEGSGGLTKHQAKDLLLDHLKNQLELERVNLIRKNQAQAQEESKKEVQRIIATVVGRVATSAANDHATTLVHLPNEEMKGRIIGREGRNIRSLEQQTGVNFLIDDSSVTIILASYDPLRRYVAKLALEELILDGRIHPASIEEVVTKVKKELPTYLRQAGEEAAYAAGVIGLAPEILELLGKLKLRYSMGQNVLEHSVEVANLMGLLAAELGLNIELAKRIGFLHDIGKGLTQEYEGSHAIVGADFAKRFGEPIEVTNGIACHHNEVEAITLEGSLCSAADAMSAARIGARRENTDVYLHRLQHLETIARGFIGVEDVCVLQAGRELRVQVSPIEINDDQAIQLARDLSQAIQENTVHGGASYPGRVRVVVTREMRVIQYTA
jgi:ribonuclease Y